MGLLADWQIRKDIKIEPFAEESSRVGMVSFGVTSYGYDVRVGRSFKVFTNVYGAVIDPKQFASTAFVDIVADHCIIPPNSFALAETVEYFEIPRDVLAVCVGKSTYARCGIICNVTPLEPEWRGKITIEISNTTPLPAKIYANEGIAQILFFRAEAVCEKSYADKKGKYQDQKGLTLPFVVGEKPAAALRIYVQSLALGLVPSFFRHEICGFGSLRHCNLSAPGSLPTLSARDLCLSEEAMNEFAALGKPCIYLANPIQLRLAEIYAIEEEAAALGWDRQDFIMASQTAGAGLAVAEADGTMIGIVLYRSLPSLAPARAGRFAEFLRWWRIWSSGGRNSAPRDLELLRIGVVQGWRRHGVGRALLTKIHQESRHAGGCIRALVPESNLAVQLLLKSAGYRAMRILHKACGGEDGFLMQRPCGTSTT